MATTLVVLEIEERHEVHEFGDIKVVKRKTNPLFATQTQCVLQLGDVRFVLPSSRFLFPPVWIVCKSVIHLIEGTLWIQTQTLECPVVGVFDHVRNAEELSVFLDTHRIRKERRTNLTSPS